MAFLDRVSDAIFGKRDSIVDPEYQRTWEVIDMARGFLDEIEKAGPISDEDLKLLMDAKVQEYRESGILADSDEKVVFTSSIRQLREGKISRVIGSIT
jgi:hypothetical protein